ncbi:leukotoxin LktA family filamentous adhesin [Megasphaera stantonii]|uniref:Leukotoxin LktA family filamentous adhesin n=1 Tax=Megasphaera stantonii TaxID=2144175 RepID=A0A346B052_9FIRM|nr:leukotoxin LktA family filamentous adhesin [Megasphaera stantonii]AXL21495.1 leukotoxin LktA family filamentous adhesin [Megasphaera stantonii]
MRYIRQFTRKQERNQTKTLEQQKHDLDLARKVLTAVTAFSFIGNPFAAMAASTVTRVDGTKVDFQNNVGNIYAEKIVNNNTAVNRFQDFKIDAGDIANMYFKTDANSKDLANNLVNFVNTRIDVHGTLNAIKENKIGGNLFFLSPEGMAVGKSGVINVGSLYVMTPANVSLDEAAYTYHGLSDLIENDTEDALNRMMTLNIPVNSSGTISVLGKINSVGDVKMAAAKIAVGKNVSGKDWADGTKNGEIVKGAVIRTGNGTEFNFSDLVNIKDVTSGKVVVDAGLGNTLAAIESGNGDIVLSAKAEDKNTDYSDFKELGKKLLNITVDLPDLPKTIEASVENYGTITAKGDAVLKAEATNGNKDWAEETLDQNTPNGVNNPDYVPVPAADADNYVQVIANVNVQGDVTAGGDVELVADADNTYVDNGTALTDKVGKILGTAITPMAANVMILSNKAQITVGKDADVTAGGTVDVHANAVLDGTAGAAANGRKLIKLTPGAIPSAAVGYANAENSATVNIEGTLTAKGENVKDKTDTVTNPAVNISAYAEENLSNSATLNLKSGLAGAETSALAAAVAVSDSANTAEVTIDGVIQADNGDVAVKADTNTLLTANAATKSPDDTIGSTAVNVMTHKGQANIVINGDITAQNVDIDATNYVDENTITANNSLGMGKLMAEAMNAANVGKITDALKQNRLVQSIINKDGTATADKPGLFKQLSEKLAVGAAIVVADETNSANVTFGKTADVTATSGNVRADADVNIYDSHIYASGTANSYKKSESGSTDTVTVGAGVVYAGMNNTASVVFEDGLDANADESHASITAAKDINITSGTTIEYNRPERIKREIDRSIENLKYAVEAIENLPEYEEEKYKDVIDGLKNLQDKLTKYAKTYSTDFMDAVNNPDAITAEGTANRIFDAAAGAVGIYNDVMDLQQNVNNMLDVTSPFGAVVSNALGVVTNAVAFTDPNNYANVAASSSAKGGQDSTKLSVAGSVTVTDFNNTSSVDVGKFTELNAGKDLDLKSVNAVEDVTITGKTKFWKNDADAKGGVGIGASVNYQNFDTYSTVSVDEGASFTAGDISIGSESDIFHVGAMLGAGKSDGSAINGMVTITDSDSYNNVIVDSDAILQAVKDADAQTNGAIDIWANNNTNVNNAILSISASGANVGAGIGVALNNIDVQNSAQVIDNDGTDDEDDDLEGKISASALSVNAETTGLINTISIAGGMTSSGEDESGEEGFFDKIKAPFDKVNETKDNVLEGVSNISNKLQSVLQTMDLNASAGSATAGDEEAGVPGFSFAGAGSVSLNLVNDTTKAVVDGANIQLENDGKLQVGARDSAFTGAWSGAAGLSFRKGQSGGSGGNTSVAVSGAVGVNDIDNEITALVKNSSITGAKDIDVTAVSGGTTVAAGIGATLTSDSTGGKNYSGGASVSVNLIDKNVNANMDDVTLTGVVEGEDDAQKAVTDIDVAAYESDVQVTGGVRADIATGGGSLVGGGVTVADIHNNINAGITGGSYTGVNDATVKGMLATTQVTAAVSAGVATGGSGTNNAFSGAAVYNGLSNDIHASIDGANIVAEGTVAVAAKDTEASSDEAKPYQALLGDYNEHNQFAADRGIDTAGTSFYNGLDTADADVDYDGNAGSTIVGAAVVATGSNGNAAGAAINIADIDNDFTASVNNASVTADDVLAEADADTLLVGAAGGVAAGTKTFGGMGSVTWQDIDNDVTAQFVNSQITTNTVTAKADNNTQAINVAGSVSVGKSAAVGATLAYNALDNTIGAYMKGNSITALGDDVDVVVDADNTGKVYGIGAGVSASTKAAINGSVAVNRGGSNTEAVIDKRDEKESYIEDAGTVKVTADDDTYRLAVVGSVSASGKAAVGGGVAYNDVGGSSAGSESSGQNTFAAIRNTDITTADNSEQAITVEANDKARLYTISVGVAAAGTAAVQGSAATALINKNVSAAFENSSVDKDGGTTADVTVEAQNASEITTSADAVSVGGRAGVGAGVAVNRIVQQTNAAVNGSQMNVKDLMVHANGTPRIENVGVGVAAAGQGAGVAGSVSVNMIDNDVTAHIGSGANIAADGSVGVVATSDEQISNYSGMLAAAGQGAGVGISVSVNQIQGETSATVGDEGTNTTVSAKGNGDGLTTHTDISEEDINNTLISSDTVDMNTTIGRQDETRKGFIVDASSTRDMKSFLINIGASVQGAGVAPTVNVNMIDGATTAGISHTSVNKGVSAGDVFVNAGDYTNMSGFVGSGGGAGMGAGVGLGSDTNTVSRDVEAVVDGSDVNAKDFEIDAESMQGVSSFTVGAGVAGIGGGVAGVVTVTDLANTTKAALFNSNVTANTVDVTADHKGIVNAGNVGVGAAGIGAGVGLSVGVLKDNSETYALVSNDSTEEKSIVAAGDVSISAQNTITVKPSISATGAGVAGVAGATSINNLNSKVVTDLANANIISKSGSIHGTANNTFNIEAYMGSQAGGAVGVGAGVTVNTIDSTVQMNVSDSELQAAQNVALTADETRNIQQTATNVAAGGAAIGANIAITTVGKKITDSDVLAEIDRANNALVNEDTQENNASALLNGAGDALKTAGIEESSVTPSIGAEYGGGKNSQITVNISNSNVTGSAIKAEAAEHDVIGMTLGSGSAGGVAINAGVGILDVNRNVGVHITGGRMTANAIDVNTNITGEANLEVYQGSAGVVSGNAAVGQVSTSGSSTISIDNARFTSNVMNVLAADHGVTNVNVLGVTVGAVSVGAIVAGAENTGNTEVKMQNSKIEDKDGGNNGTVSIKTDKANTVTAHAMGGAGGALAAQGVVATASDEGESRITLQAGNALAAKEIAIAAKASPAVKAVADSAAVSVFGTAGGAGAEATANGTVSVTVADGNELNADTVDISADAATQDGKNTAEAAVVGASGSGYYTLAENLAKADVAMNVTVDVGDVAYKTETTKTLIGYKDVEDSTTGERTEVYAEDTKGVTNLTLSSNNAAKASADAKGITIGGIFSSGNNQALTSNTSQTKVSLRSGSENTRLGSLTVTAAGAGDNTAKADGSGGGFISGDLAAYVKNEMNATTQADISGMLEVEGDVRIEALQSDTANINADALKATVVGASATKAENSITGTTGVSISGAAITGGGDMDVNAANTVTFGDKENYAVEGSGYGGVNVQGAEFDNTIDKKANIAIANSTITTDGAQNYEAKTTGNLNIGGYIKAAGLGAFTWVDVDNTVTSTDRVSVDENSSLKTKKAGKDIVLAAVDNVDMAVIGVADTQGGAVGGASSDVTSTLNRNNSIAVDGTLYSMNDVNLYAGKDKDGSEGKLDLEADSESYNKTALAVSNPKLNDAVNQNNTVTIGSGSEVSSVRNINLYADAGKETIRDSSVLYTWYWSDKDENYTSSTVGHEEPNNKHSNNFVQADGTLTAGVQNKQYITIGGTYDPETGTTDASQLIFFDDQVKDAVNAYENGQEAVGKDDLIINASDGVDKDGIGTGTMDYGTTLFERYNELGELMQAYAEDPSSTAYLGYKAERDRIMSQMESMGLIEEIKVLDNEGKPTGETYKAPVEGATIDYIELSDIVASGGNINIQSDNLSGEGSLTAKGAPEVVVNNNTNLYLKVNDITIGEAGGEIHYNNTSLTGDAAKDNATIKGLNKDGMSANFAVISPDAAAETGGRIVINGNYGGTAVYANVTIDGQTQTIQTTPRADIEINGLVDGGDGIVEISSAANNIVIQGDSASDSAGVKGKTVKLSASKGSVSQGFQEGIVSIGGDVQDQYASQYDEGKNHFDTEYGFQHDTVHDEWSKNEEVKSDGNRIAGENIYISAADININGEIQSGYEKYVVEIKDTNEVQNKINDLRQNWLDSGSGVLSDAEIMTGDTYRIVTGEDVRGEDGVYYRTLDVYYNPYTGQLVVPDVDAHGGQVYLTGRISSTGSGSIKVLDGAYDINVHNDTTTDLQLGKLVSNDVSGLISITDTAKNTLTEFTRGQTIVKDLTKLEDGDYVTLDTIKGGSNVYKPQEGLRYNWTTGQEVTTKEEYSNTIKAGLWGAVETMDKTQLDDFEESHKPSTPAKETEKDKPNGEYIGSISTSKDGIDNDDNFIVIYDNTKLNEDRVGPGEPERWSTGFLGWFKWEKYTWTKVTGTSQQYVASVKADKPIEIGFFGNADGNSNININAAGNINLTNTIGSASSGTGSVIDIASTGGAINQKGGSLVGDNINLQAAAGINDVNITSMGDTVQLNAVNSGSGDVTIDVSAAYGTKGNVVINQLFAGSADAQKGNVSLTAAGNITQSGTGVSVSGNRIDLTSENGAIGTDEQAIVVNGGQSIVDGTDSLSASVNAQAKDDINLTQAQGDMRIGRVYSDNGDVTITVTNGSLIDALPDGETIDHGSTDALIQKWKDLGLIDGDGKYTESQEQDVAEYEAAVRNEFEQYEMLKGYYEDGEQHSNDTGYAAYEKLAETYGGYESADAYLAGDAARTHIGELRKEGAGWSEDQLLYAISDAVINQESGATDTIVKDPNLKGHNITLNVNKDVGRNSDETTKIQLAGLGSRVEDLKQLANANAGSVTWNEAEGVAIINEKTPLGVQLTGTGGSLNVQAGGNVYLAGRTEGDGEVTNVLNVDSIKGGNIRLQGKDGIYNVHADLNEAAITGNNLLMQGGDGSIGTADKAMTIDVSGPVQMTAGDNIYVNQVGDDALQIYSMGAGQDIVLAAKTDIVSANTPVSSDEEDDEDGGTVLASGYIRSDGGSISLTAGGAIGTEGQGLRILDNGAVVNAAAQGDIYVAGVSGTGSTGTLAIGKINSAGGDASITAETDIAFAADSLVSVQNGTGTLTLTAEQGSVTQGKGEEDSGIYAGTVDVSSKGSQLLENAQNTVTNFVVRGLEEDNSLTGNVHLVSGAETVHINFSADEEKGLTVNDGSITVHHNGSADGELRVTGSATTKNASSDDSIKTDIVMSSLGSLTSDGALDSAGNVCMDAAGNITQKNSVTAVGEAMFTSDAGSISLTGTTTAGRVEATTESEADEGTITFSGDVTANTGDITVDSNGGAITIGSSAVSEKSYIDLSSETGAITVTGSAKAGGDVTAETKDGSITFGQESTKTGSVTSATGNVTAKTDSGNISVYGTADADKDILFESSVSGTIRVDGTSTAGQHFTAETGSGDIALNGSVKAMDGDVTATSKKGSISTSEDVFAGQNVTVETVSGLIDLGGKVTAKAGAITATTTGNTSGTSGSITLKGDADAAQTITLSSDGGAITVTGSAKADGDVTAETKDGSITFGQEGSADSSVTSESGEVKATTGRGDITIYGTSTAGTDFTAKTDAGDITLDGNITAQTGMVMAQAFSGSISAGGTITSASNTELTATGVATDDSGNITVNGEIASGKEVHASATNGSIRFEGTTTASAGDVTATVSGDGDITFNGAVTAVSEGDAGGNIAATVSGTGNITTDRDAVFKADKDIQFTTNAGSITTNSEVDAGGNLAFTVETKGDMIVRDDLTAGQNIDLNVNSGNILFEGTQGGVREDIYVTSDQGDVTVSINESGSGDIKDTNGEGETGDRAHLKAGEGNVTVKHDGIGDVDLYEVYAKQDAGISVADGNLHLVDVSGNLVAIFVKSEGKEMDVENIEAAQQIAISGSNMDLDSIKQREDGDGFLVITPEGTADDQPIDNLVIGDILTNGGVRFDHLWLNTGNIHVSEGALHLDKVYVQDKATFSTDDMTTNVFGSAPVYDDSVSSSYWVNTSINSPKDDLAAWNSDELNDKWMHIFFSPEGTVQISNGNLLHLADHNYAYNQRYSQVDWMNIFTDKDFYNFYDRYYAPELSYHERYGLTSGSGHSVENAEEDEVIVE